MKPGAIQHVLPRQLAQQFARLAPLDLNELPFALPPFELELVHLSHRQHDPALAWLEGQLLAIPPARAIT